MDIGAAALAFGLGAALVLEVIPRDWMRAAGGLLVLLTLAAIGLQLLGLA